MRVGQTGLLFLIAMGFLTLAIGSGPLWFYPFGIGFFVAMTWWTIWVAPRRRARETREGIHTWDIGFPVGRLVRWSTIEQFERRRTPFGQLVFAIHRYGSSTAIMGLDAAAVTSWEGAEPGQTDDMVAELNRRLVLWRQELDLEGPRDAA